MAFVKANLTVVICGIVVLVALGVCIWPTLGMDEGLQKEMQDRFSQGKAANGLIMKKVEIYPGGPVLETATAESNLIAAKSEASGFMKRQGEEVAKIAAEFNSRGRVKISKGAGGAADNEIPYLYLAQPKLEDNFLPVKSQAADPWGFKKDYEDQFPLWVAKLVGGSFPGTAPTLAETQLLIDAANAEKAKQEAAAGAIFRPAGGSGSAQLSAMQGNQIRKAAVISRAAKIHCYVDDAALQKRAWFQGRVPPNEVQMFEAFVDSWFQQDVVNAIVALNDTELAKQSPADRNVGHAPIKRLEGIIIGNGAMGNVTGGGNAGPLFMGVTMNSGTAVTTASGLDYGRSVTGHVATNDYDVALMKIIVDIDPAYENQFIASLYHQNNGYTVINRSMKTVDPLEATSNGFLYGSSQVIRLELLVEGLLFRSWTVQLMPADFRKQTGTTGVVGPPGGGGPFMGPPGGGFTPGMGDPRGGPGGGHARDSH